jgi:hypothetical protein
MRRPLIVSAAVAALLLGSPAHAQNQQQPSGNQQQKSDGKSLAQPEHQEEADGAMNTKSGQAGKDEPGSHAPSQDTAVFWNGKLNVPGAPTEGQTVPAKFSERNAKLDKLPVLGMRLPLTNDQTRVLADGIKKDNVPVADIKRPELSTELPVAVELHDLPQAVNLPSLQGLKYVRLADRIMLVQPGNRIVVGEIAL